MSRFLFVSFLSFVFVMPVFAAPMTVEEREAQQEARQEAQTERQSAREEAQEERKLDREQLLEERQEEQIERFCERFSETRLKLSENMIDRVSRYDGRVDNRLDRLTARYNEQDVRLAKHRELLEEKYGDFFDRLEEGASSDNERDRLEDLRKTFFDALYTRYDSVDVALDSYRTGVMTILTEREANFSDIVRVYSDAVSEAASRISASCGSEDRSDMQMSFQKALSGARDDFQDARENVVDVSSDIHSLADERRVAVQKAFDDYRIVVDGVRFEVKDMFSEEEAEGVE